MYRTQYASLNTQYDTRDTLHASRNSALHLSRELYKSNLFLQNEPNFKIAQNDINSCNANTYGNLIALKHPKNEPKRTQNEPNFSSKLASFSPNEPNFKPNYVKIGNLKSKKLTRNADFFDEPQRKFRAVREEAFERLDLVNIRPAVFIGFYARTAGIIIKPAIYIIKRIFPTAGGAIGVNRTKIIF